MKCEYCDNEVPAGKTICPSCGAAVQQRGGQQAEQWNTPRPSSSAMATTPEQINHPRFVDPRLYMEMKSRIVYIILALLFGELGLHNFYAGYVGRGIVQLLITILSFGLLFWISWIWAIIELCVVTHDGRGVSFK